MTSTTCLNCEKELTDKFCSGCGQKADTHRITFRNFLFHDVLHGTLHIEKGILFTAKQALIRPGEAALEYISGKRKRYYNVFYLILLTIGLILFVRHFYDQAFIDQIEKSETTPYLNEASKRLDAIIAKQSKLLVLLFVPFAALNSFVLFRRKNLNLSEHFILAGMILLGVLLISAFGNILYCLNLIQDSELLTNAINTLTPILVVVYIGYGYINAFAADYSYAGAAFRAVLFFGLLSLEIALLFMALMGYVTDWKFGQVSINPFG